MNSKIITPFISIVLILFFGTPFIYSNDNKIKVAVTHGGEDQIGPVIAFDIREIISDSSRYELTNSNDCTIEISIISLPMSQNKTESYSSALSVAYIFYPKDIRYLYTHSIFLVGTYRIEEIAGSITADLDKAVENSHMKATLISISTALMKMKSNGKDK